MANLSSTEIADRALEALGVKAATQDATAEDAARALESVTTVYSQLHKEGVAPFAISAVPDWAQSALIHLAALDLVPTFNSPDSRVTKIQAMAMKGRIDLATQTASVRAPLPITSDYF